MTEPTLHSEQQPDEIYLGNATAETLLISGWKTSRRGVNPLTENGLPINNSAMKPWFIKTDEVRKHIVAEKARQPGTCAIAVAALERLVERRSLFPLTENESQPVQAS